VRVLRREVEVARAIVPARSAVELALPRVEALAASRRSSTLERGGAYRVLSDRPVAAYQYNPLEFRAHDECVYTGTGGELDCFSFSNDASLLLPAHSLGTSYLADARRAVVGAGSFVAIAATEDASLRVTVTSATAPAADGTVPALTAGETLEIDLHGGDVLQLVSLEGSLAGTEIEGDAPLLVVAGADCANVPAASPACDHLEETMPPIESWGRSVVAAAPRSVEGEPSVLRVMSGADGNVITMTGLPGPIRLDRGETFEVLTEEDALVEGTGPLLVTQYLVGALYFDRAIPRRDATTVGDPSMGVATSLEQLRTSYAFVVPSTFDRNTAAIVAHADDEVRLDGSPIASWDAVGSSPWRVARVPIAGGAHVLTSRSGAGLSLYGVAPFTSYLLPGGLDVETLQ
ncbi:MAG TPA: IgGFc-binding protein, partial [Sandaracinaceae bacterium]